MKKIAVIAANGKAANKVITEAVNRVKNPAPIWHPVRRKWATIPAKTEPVFWHQKYYSMVLLTWASIARVILAKGQARGFAKASSLTRATHVKSLSQHKISGGSLLPEWWLSHYRTGGSAAPEYSSDSINAIFIFQNMKCEPVRLKSLKKFDLHD